MSEPQQVISSDGRRGVILGDSDPSRDDPRFVRVRMEDGRILHVPVELLELRPDGAFNLQIGLADMEGLITGDAQTREVGEATGPGRLVLPVAIEEMEVGRRTVTTGLVRVRKHVREHEEVLDETVSREDVHVERMPIGTIVDTPPTIRNEGSTLIIPVLEEVLVVEKRLRLKEEVHITWQRVVEPAPQRVTLRDEELTVERIDPNEATPAEGHPLERPTG